MAWDNTFRQQILELSISEDVSELRDERTIKHNKITKEEIEQLTIDESLSPTDRAIYILRNGQPVQKVSTVSALDSLLADDNSLLTMLPLVGETIKQQTSESELQIGCTQLLNRLMQDGRADRQCVFNIFFPHLLQQLLQENSEVCEAWLDTLSILIAQTKKDSLSIQRKCMQFVEENGSLSNCSSTRKVCCKILSCLSFLLKPDEVIGKIIPKMRSFCQDIDLDVRARMCRELEFMINNLAWEINLQYTIPELHTLIADEEATVRQTALETISNVLPIIPRESVMQTRLVDLVLECYNKVLARNHAEELVASARMIGRTFFTLSEIITKEELKTLLDCYLQLSSLKPTQENPIGAWKPQDEILGITNHETMCRYWCAYNFPGVLSCIEIETFVEHLLPCFKHFVHDKSAAVRKTIACSVHQVAKLLDHSAHIIQPSVKHLLKDKEIDVLDKILGGLPLLLQYLRTSSSKPTSPTHHSNASLQTPADFFLIGELLTPLLACEEHICSSLRWRVHEKYFRSIACLHLYISQEQISLRVVPRLFHLLTTHKVKPVSVAIAQCLLTYMKYNRNYEEQTNMCSQLIQLLARSANSKHRVLFMELYPCITQLFSRKFFKQRFYDVAMEMAVDPVVNVRLKLCTSLPLLKSQLRLPWDRMMLQTLELNVRRIMALETNREVSNTIRNVIMELDLVRVSFDTSSIESENEDREKEKFESLIEECEPARSRNNSTTSKDTTVRRTKEVLSKPTRSNPSVSTRKSIGSSGVKELYSSSSKTSATKQPTKKSSSSHHSTPKGK